MDKYKLQKSQGKMGFIILNDKTRVAAGIHSVNDDGTVTYIDSDALVLLQNALRNNPAGMAIVDNPEIRSILANKEFQKNMPIGAISDFQEG